MYPENVVFPKSICLFIRPTYILFIRLYFVYIGLIKMVAKDANNNSKGNCINTIL